MFELAIIAVALILAYTAKPKKSTSTPPSMLDSSNVPTATSGTPISILFGTVLIEDPNVEWFGDIEYVPIKK